MVRILPKWERDVVDTGFVRVDMRWQESGWLQAFRLRLTGWLPSEEVSIGLAEGVFENCRNGQVHQVQLSSKGLDLTDLSDHSRTMPNFVALANILRMREFHSDWIDGTCQKTARLNDKDYAFDEDFRAGIFEALESVKAAG